jgi:hypothetical protein
MEQLQKVLDNFDISNFCLWEPGEKTMCLFAKLPNGFEIVVSAHALDPERHDPERAKAVLARKLAEKLMELGVYSQSGKSSRSES